MNLKQIFGRRKSPAEPTPTPPPLNPTPVELPPMTEERGLLE